MASQPSRAEQTMDALVQAFVRLLDQRSAGEISVRDIGAEAGMNHGLVHHYFGSKEALLHEAALRVIDALTRDRPDGFRPSLAFEHLRAQAPLVRAVTRICLDGPHELLELTALPPKAREARTREIRSALEQLGGEDLLTPDVLDAAGMAMLFGWIALRPLLQARFRLPPDADEQLAAVLKRLDAFVLLAAQQAEGARP
jgi:AcrR family transcriptional regulator